VDPFLGPLPALVVAQPPSPGRHSGGYLVGVWHLKLAGDHEDLLVGRVLGKDRLHALLLALPREDLHTTDTSTQTAHREMENIH
jgi:hypothetical protein